MKQNKNNKSGFQQTKEEVLKVLDLKNLYLYWISIILIVAAILLYKLSRWNHRGEFLICSVIFLVVTVMTKFMK